MEILQQCCTGGTDSRKSVNWHNKKAVVEILKTYTVVKNKNLLYADTAYTVCSVHHVIPYVQEMPGSNYENIGKKFKNATISSLYKEYLNKFNKNSQIRYTISPFSCLANRKKPKTKSKNPK